MKEVEKKDVPEVSGGFFPPEHIGGPILPPIPGYPQYPGPVVPLPDPPLINPND